MIVICWNIRKNSANKFPYESVVKSVSAIVNSASGVNKAWLLAILENTDGTGGTELSVGQKLMNLLGAGWCHIKYAGGEASTKEYVVLVGKNCTLKNSYCDERWKAAFNAIQEQKVTEADNEAQTNGYLACLRKETKEDRTRSLVDAAPWNADKCRSPVCVEVTVNSEERRFAFVHSPGPSEKARLGGATETYAKEYFGCICSALIPYGLDGLFGDFNVHSIPFVPDGMKEAGYVWTGTTYEKGSKNNKKRTLENKDIQVGWGKLGSSKFDRCF